MRCVCQISFLGLMIRSIHVFYEVESLFAVIVNCMSLSYIRVRSLLEISDWISVVYARARCLDMIILSTKPFSITFIYTHIYIYIYTYVFQFLGHT